MNQRTSRQRLEEIVWRSLQFERFPDFYEKFAVTECARDTIVSITEPEHLDHEIAAEAQALKESL